MDADANRTGPVTISRELFDFLMGAGGIDGLHFGEHQPDAIGAFWWRRLLRDADTGAAADVMIGDIEASIEPIRHWYDSVDHQPRPLVHVVADMVLDVRVDRELLTAMHLALRAQDGAEKEFASCDQCRGRVGVEPCARCSELFDRAVALRRAALDDPPALKRARDEALGAVQ